MRRRSSLAVGIYLLLTFFISGGALAWYWFFLKDVEKTDDAFIDGHITKVSSSVSGHITRVLAQDNQWIEAGSVLIELDARDHQLALEQAQAAKVVAMARNPQLNSEIAALEANLRQTEARLLVAKAEYLRDSEEYRRYHQSRSSWSQSQLSLQRSASWASAARLAAAEHAVMYNQALLEKGKAGLVENNALLQQLDVDIDKAKLRLSYTKIVAPSHGYITQRNVNVGDYITAGTTLLSLVSDNVWVTANFKETQLAKMSPGQKVTVMVDAYPQYKYDAVVDSIQRGTGPVFSLLPAENATGNYIKIVQRVPVKITFTDRQINKGQHHLVPGMSVIPYVDVK
ncbi:HlyD family secretion protein [Entomohabitans teleogrylli]|uniref:HlyD family secretion protein n=1 Tax=Entomohabitans teleogrylli TaxID=1384589 RepID=UPI000AB2DE9F|nr:HlyD family secretion protein [Entomohabitans teleogrylli]